MSAAWPLVALGEVLKRADRFESKDELSEYQFAGTYSFGRGIFRGENKQGASFQLPKVQRIKTDDFIYCKIMAWEGAFGLASKDVDGCVLSGAFVAYEINRKRLDPKFIDYFFKIKSVWKNIGNKSTGTNVRRQSLHPDEFEAATIPLPPLAEQQRIVARIEELAAKIHEARGFRQQAVEETEALIVSYAHRYDLDSCGKLAQGWISTTLRDVVTLVQDLHKVNTDTTYPNIGIFSYARGLFKKPHIAGLQTSATYLNRVHAGQFIYSRLFAFEGAYGMVNDEFDNYFVSNEYPTFNCNTEKVLPDFLYAYFKNPTVWKDVAVGSKGLGDRRQRVQPQQILTHRFMLPPIEYQYGLRQLMAKAGTLKQLHSETAAELDAMLPSILDKAFQGAL